ncbi:hypothetical protein GCM10011613_30350 [Cellvibrio zantedeschiae]|uniref:DUF4236 domain-containing protein n=1 Tax=Cellvibrio zantedeschiae TaxID=1237077 RepID=A0ABQ3B8H6_9GAMM|nr:DUF4236 domain-containing protein [Cellvibrio zantedeschiae]GGY83389.1 hypothetical protein GCM10011613_30350 [Cellvibrio zantedeschiae]
MGFRFRRSVRIVPGVRLNFGKKGTSISLGGRGATVTFSKHGTRYTAGIPGTGISYTEYKKNNVNKPISHTTERKNLNSREGIYCAIIVFCFFLAFHNLWLALALFVLAILIDAGISGKSNSALENKGEAPYVDLSISENIKNEKSSRENEFQINESRHVKLISNENKFSERHSSIVQDFPTGNFLNINSYEHVGSILDDGDVIEIKISLLNRDIMLLAYSEKNVNKAICISKLSTEETMSLLKVMEERNSYFNSEIYIFENYSSKIIISSRDSNDYNLQIKVPYDKRIKGYSFIINHKLHKRFCDLLTDSRNRLISSK